MNSFYIEKEPHTENKYYIALRIVIYRELHGKYPHFLEHYDNADARRFGYSTKFGYLTEHIMLEKEEAERICKELEEKYSHILKECEDSGEWSDSPFDFATMDMLWSK